MGDGVVDFVLQFGDGARGWYGREDRYLTPSSPSIGGQGCVIVELGDGESEGLSDSVHGRR